jgi:uncharacterized protein (TIGR02246 family)
MTTADDEQAIRNLVEQWMTASKAGDHATLLSLMTEDVVFLVPGQPPFGRDAFANRTVSPNDPTIDGEAQIVEMNILGDWAYLRNRLRIIITPRGGKPIVKSGYTLTILRKNASGQWQLSRDANLLATEPAEIS